jgi:1,4-dihydroxy-2-naphthoate octaprenyltransferase
MPVPEPTVDALSNPVVRYLMATRPPFLTASLVPCLLGLAAAYHAGVGIDPLAAWLTLLGAVAVHAGVNVLNDYYDALNGTDALNSDRLYPFTGGSRFIQNGVLGLEETARLGWGLLGLGMLVGLLLLHHAGWPLLVIGLAGLLLGWGYSAPPLRLNSRGLGEVSVAAGFGVLIPLGADLVQRGSLDPQVLWVAAPYALLITAVLYINQFPDRRADAAAGKRHWVVRLGPGRARWGYPLLVLGAYGLLLGSVASGHLPRWSLAAVLPAIASLMASRDLLAFAATPARLRPAVELTILAATAHGVILAASLWLAGL